MSKRKHQRFTKRLETTFASGDSRYRGISSDLSEGGLFIRTQNGLIPGTTVDIEIFLPDNTVCRMKGTVRWTMKDPLARGSKNGMGIEIIEQDPRYLDFLRSKGIEIDEDSDIPLKETVSREIPDEKDQTPEVPEFILFPCPLCNTENRILKAEVSLKPRCVRCGVPIDTGDMS